MTDTTENSVKIVCFIALGLTKVTFQVYTKETMLSIIN